MSRRGNILPHDRIVWLLAIGRRLEAEYAAVSEPVPDRLAALVRQLETRTATTEPEPDDEHHRRAAVPLPHAEPDLANAAFGTSVL
jgi:hypothetical protein